MHFIYTGEAHGDGYVNYRTLTNKDNRELLRDVSLAILSKIVAEADLDEREIIVTGPETLGALMVDTFSERTDLPCAIATIKLLKDGGGFKWETDPEWWIDAERQVVWIDDLLNAGSTLRKSKKMVEALGSEITAVGVIGDRSGLSAEDLGVGHIVSLEQFNLTRYDLTKESCPMCDARKPIVLRPGHGWEFEHKTPNYPGGFVDIK